MTSCVFLIMRAQLDKTPFIRTDTKVQPAAAGCFGNDQEETDRPAAARKKRVSHVLKRSQFAVLSA